MVALLPRFCYRLLNVYTSFAGTLEIRGGYHKDKKEGYRTSDSHFDQSSYIAVGFTDADICPFEGDPKVTCKSFIEPLPGYGTKKQEYGGNVLHFIPHRVQVFSITNLGDSLNRIANEAVVKRGRERAVFEQQANTSLADEVDEKMMDGAAEKGYACRIQHVSSGLFVQPTNQRFVPAESIGIQLVLGPDPDAQDGVFLFLSNGCLQHIQSGLFISQSLGSPMDGAAIVLGGESDGGPPSAFELTEALCLVERGSGLLVHPEGGKGSEGVKLVLLPEGQTGYGAAEYMFVIERLAATTHALEDSASVGSSLDPVPSPRPDHQSQNAAADEPQFSADDRCDAAKSEAQ
jgi:hypothetical protein